MGSHHDITVLYSREIFSAFTLAETVDYNSTVKQIHEFPFPISFQSWPRSFNNCMKKTKDKNRKGNDGMP